MFGNRAIYHDGWIAATTPPRRPGCWARTRCPDVVNGYKWELYNIAEDYSESNDLAAKMPDKLREMQELFLVEAAKYNVFPLDNSVLRALTDATPERHRRAERVHLLRGNVRPARQRRTEHPQPSPTTSPPRWRFRRAVREGMIATLGGRFGGYGLYLLKGKPVFLYNFLDLERFRWEGKDALTPGKHTIVLRLQL